MEIRISETAHVDITSTILADIGKYDDVTKWIKDIVNHKTAFYPIDCAVKTNGKWYTLIRGAVIEKDVEKVIKRLSQLPKNTRVIPNDTMLINSDTFEHELYFNLDGE